MRDPPPKGAKVERGEQIAELADPSYGSHLHLAIRPGMAVARSDEATCPNNRLREGFVDPLDFLDDNQP